jgi:hypothetical protein
MNSLPQPSSPPSKILAVFLFFAIAVVGFYTAPFLSHCAIKFILIPQNINDENQLHFIRLMSFYILPWLFALITSLFSLRATAPLKYWLQYAPIYVPALYIAAALLITTL